MINNICISQNYSSPFDFPLLISGTFGELRDHHFHTGIDVKTGGTEGKSLRSIEDGYISRIKVSTWGYGKVLYINHPSTGHTSVYAHMQNFNKKIDSIIQIEQYKNESFEINYYPKKNSILVKKGEVIGLSGNSGGSGGPHLHFEIRDNKTGNPINPLFFDFNVEDNINPILTEIKIYNHENSSLNGNTNDLRIPLILERNGVYTLKNSNLTAHGNISFGISTFDRQDGSPNNKNGVYSIKMFVDNKLIHHFEADELVFSEKRFINSHIDYAEYTDNNIRFNRCYSVPYNKLSNYKININKGIINFSDTNLHQIKFEVSDIENNKSIIQFEIQSQPNSNKKKTYNKKNVCLYDEAMIYENDEFEAYIPAYSLYNDCNFEYKVSDKKNTTLSKIHHFMNKNIPIHNDIVITIKEKIPNELIDKSYIGILRDNGNYSYIGKTFKNGSFHAKTKEFGSFTILSDTLKPIIYDYKLNNEKVSVKITDKESGISFYRGEINGRWILMEYDYKTKLLTFFLNEEKLKNGENKLKIIVRDRLNNESIFTKSFNFTN
tara:strand:- start:3367 stop:5013 length:1647 start_codon:yes stop_codon:yes gene_type:complete